MSDKVRNKIGDELYNKILETGLKPNEFDLLNGYVPRDRLNEVSNKLKSTEAKITDYESQIDETKKLLQGNEEFKDKYNVLSEKYKNDLALKDKEIVNNKKQYKIIDRLKGEGMKHPEVFMNQIDFDKLSFDNDNLLGLDDVIKDFKGKYEDMFITKTSTNNVTQSNKNDNDNNDNNNDNDDWGEIFKQF
jgi:hypothetical protein